ncbi:hypothetical protein F0365_10260 [Nonlabens sp. Ci31]|jgi:hypothetical protein|uniref:hypothetical protein n=1 Tax=Nonlabens sp. Ci31 TaxID=2608253 RepID=UPI0014635B66|nr:hypothetical protein [Nonlabens sp. Ci31]QJP34747.1 hypothetical protein F0365_10260 [Nonlabens sp. Ci31]
MELILYTERYDVSHAVHNFMDFYYSVNMKYLASDLLDKGLSPEQITAAVEKAIKVAHSSGIGAHKHFMPIFSGLENGVIQDCKLSHLAYGLVLMNADANLYAVGEFQVDVLKGFLNINL